MAWCPSVGAGSFGRHSGTGTGTDTMNHQSERYDACPNQAREAWQEETRNLDPWILDTKPEPNTQSSVRGLVPSSCML
jgi:hypothetical protein